MPEFIEDNLRIIIFVVIAGLAVFQKVMEAAKAKKQDSGPTMKEIFGPDDATAPRPARRPYTPPPLVRTSLPPQVPGPPPLRQAPVPPPLRQSGGMPVVASAHDTEAEMVRQREMEERLRKIREAKAARPSAPATAPVPQAAPQQREAVVHGVVHRRLRQASEVRRAFVLKEILDRPLGLR